MLLIARSARLGIFPLHDPGDHEVVDLPAVDVRRVVRLFAPARLRVVLRTGAPVRCTRHRFAAAANAFRADFGVEIFVRLIVLMRHFL